LAQLESIRSIFEQFNNWEKLKRLFRLETLSPFSY
jgi:hypothetical protein